MRPNAPCVHVWVLGRPHSQQKVQQGLKADPCGTCSLAIFIFHLTFWIFLPDPRPLTSQTFSLGSYAPSLQNFSLARLCKTTDFLIYALIAGF